MRLLPLLLLVLLLAPAAAAQDAPADTAEALAERARATRPDANAPVGPNLAVPLAWQVRLDRPADDVVIGADRETADIFFVNMTPGWHVTTGPAGIFWHPASTAEGHYRAEAKIYLFDPGDRNEAYGFFVGGRDLDGDAQAYDYFLVRNTGEFLVKRRTGAETSVLLPWTAHEAVAVYGDDTQGTVLNTLAVEAGPETVRFFVNDAEVASLPRADVHADGVVGLRLNHALNVHVADLRVTPAE